MRLTVSMDQLSRFIRKPPFPKRVKRSGRRLGNKNIPISKLGHFLKRKINIDTYSLKEPEPRKRDLKT